MNLRNLSDREVLMRAEGMADDRTLSPTAQRMISELAWRLERQLDLEFNVDPYRMPRFKRGPDGRFTCVLEQSQGADRDEGARHVPLLADVRG